MEKNAEKIWANCLKIIKDIVEMAALQNMV